MIILSGSMTRNRIKLFRWQEYVFCIICILYAKPFYLVCVIISIGVFVVYIDTGSRVPNIPSKSRDLADENNKILTEWKWFETTVLWICRWRMNMLGTSQYRPRLSSITIVAPGGSANQIAVFTSNWIVLE
jgi:hypothetical protein